MASCSKTLWEHDVFLSFRGEDTRKSFVSHLYEELTRQGITTFKDDENLEIGTHNSVELLKAIESSKIAIVIISPNFAFSSFCLQELEKIMECWKNGSLFVHPVFYDIDPSDVRKRTGILAEALDKHRKENRSNLRIWEEALTQVANVVGDHSLNWKDDAGLIRMILKDVNAKLNRGLPRDYGHYVGMDTHMECLWPLLSVESQQEVRMIGICGMGGIGKTTIAKHICTTLLDRFQGFCFMENVKKIYKERGERYLQSKFLSDILKTKEISIEDVFNVSGVIKARLGNRKVLIILDDVDRRVQIDCLAGGSDWFGPGSRIIVTSREKELLKDIQVYDVSYLKHDDAVKLFRQYACVGEASGDEYLKLSDRAARYAKGLPLALRVWGSHVCGQDKADWEVAIEELRKNCHREIMEVLKPSYDALETKAKDIFLYIACHWLVCKIDFWDDLLKFKYQNARHWIRVLVNRSLLDIRNDGFRDIVEVHDVLREMGREIDGNQTGRFVTSSAEARALLEHAKGTKDVECMRLDLAEIEGLKLSRNAFNGMYNLRHLVIYGRKDHVTDSFKVEVEELEFLPSTLGILIWTGYPLRCLPKKFNPECMIVLNLSFSNVERLWKGEVCLPHVQSLKLEHCKKLKKLPDLSMAPTLVVLVLEGCSALVEVSCSIVLPKLLAFVLTDCVRLKTFPWWPNMEALLRLSLDRCGGLKKFPQVSTSIRMLSLSSTSIEEIPPFIGLLSNLEVLDVSETKIKSISSEIGKLERLQDFNLRGCNQLLDIPVQTISQMKSLKEDAVAEIQKQISKQTGIKKKEKQGRRKLNPILRFWNEKL